MFYVKTKLSEETIITTDITDENVFTRCVECGKERLVDIVNLITVSKGDFCLFSTGLYCEECSKRYAKK